MINGSLFVDGICVFTTSGGYVSTASKVSIATLQYRKGHAVCIGEDDETGLPQFGKIDCFVSCSNNNHWYLVVECVRTVDFSAHVHDMRTVYASVNW